MNDTLTPELQDIPELELRVADRCDSCVAQAFFVAAKVVDGKPMYLLLCGHHGASHEPALVMQGFTIQDYRDRINAKPMSGAPEGSITAED